ncbi:MAG: hypothetical protein IPN29_09445 [Saprospiraceae bacterium]|nr:hypothetical protein [Saprospiraceae bacterium]
MLSYRNSCSGTDRSHPLLQWYSWVAPTITDNCLVIELAVDLDGATNEGYANGVQQANFAPGTYNIVYTHVGPDTVSCEFTVTVIDTIDPVIVCPAIVEVACIEDVPTPHTNFVPFISEGGILDDNCTVNLSTLVWISDTGLPVTECVNRDTITRVYSVSDIYGNSNTCEQTIIVYDDIDPTFVSFAPDTLINCDADSTVAALGTPVAEDNCVSGLESLTHSNVSTQGIDPTLCSYYSYVVTRTWVATDVCGNSVAVNQIITVQDTTDPTALCLDISVNLDPTGNVSIVAADVNNNSTDNCMAPSLLNLTATPLDFTCDEVGPNNVVLTVTDACGNASTCVAVVTVVDTVPPVAICETAIYVYLDDDGLATIDTTDINNGSWDNCAIDTMTLSVSAFDCSDVGPAIPVTLTVYDVYGNSAFCVTLVTVLDTIDPVAVCQDIDLYLDENGLATVDAEDLDGGSTDACGGLTFEANPEDFTCANVGPNTVVLTVTDVNLNSATCTAIVTVIDTIDPVAVCQNIDLYLDATGNATVDAEDLDGGSTDACGGLTFEANPEDFTCANVGPNTVVLTVTDVNLNSATCTAIVTVIDTIDPVAVCQDTTIYLDVLGNASVIAAQLDGGSTDACGGLTFSASQTSFGCADVGPNVVEVTVTDVNLNSSTCNAIVTVLDTIDPVAVCQNINLYLDANGEATVDAEDLDGGSTDACAGFTYSANPADFDCSDVGPNTVILTVTDINNNSATCTAIVTVIDTIDPIAICQDVDVYLDVDGEGSTTAALVNDGSSDACGIDTMYLDIYDFTCSDVSETNTVILTVVDVNGNSATCSAIVTVIDTIDPVAICMDTTIYLDVNGLASVTAPQLDGGSSDACGGLTFAASQTAFDCDDIGANNITVTVTDVNLNSSTCVAVVTVLDTLNPVFSQCFGPDTLDSDPNGCYAD